MSPQDRARVGGGLGVRAALRLARLTSIIYKIRTLHDQEQMRWMSKRKGESGNVSREDEGLSGLYVATVRNIIGVYDFVAELSFMKL